MSNLTAEEREAGIVELDAEAERLDPGHLGRVNADQRRAIAELRTVLGALLNLFDPPGEAKRRHHAEDERGFWMAVSGAVQIGRKLIQKPPACRMCRGGGADEYGAECSDCDGEGYDAKAPITAAERRVWDAIARNVAERAKEE